jgi:hypothetical protein
MTGRLKSRLYFHACCFILFFVAASISFDGYYQKWHFGEADVPGDNIRASFESMVDGTAYRPYVYRQLLPSIANWADGVVPTGTKDRLYDLQASGDDADTRFASISDSATANSKPYFFRYLVLYIATFLCAWLSVWAMYLVCDALGAPEPAAVFAPVIFILLLPYLMSNGGFFYDYPELAFMSLAVWMAIRFDWWWIIPLAALGAWNKESFLLFIPTLYPFFRMNSTRNRAILSTGILCLVCAAVYLPIRLRFASNPGGTVELWWTSQLSYILHPRNLLYLTEETYGIRTLKAYTIIPVAMLVWTVWRGWRYLPSAIKRHGKIAAVINFPLFLLFGFPGELRGLSMLYVFLLLVIAGNLSSWILASVRTEPLTAAQDARSFNFTGSD